MLTLPGATFGVTTAGSPANNSPYRAALALRLADQASSFAGTFTPAP